MTNTIALFSVNIISTDARNYLSISYIVVILFKNL